MGKFFLMLCHVLKPFFSITVYIQYFDILYQFQVYSMQSVPPRYFQHPIGTIHTYYNVIDYFPYAVLYISMAVLYLPMCTSQSLHLFQPAPYPRNH